MPPPTLPQELLQDLLRSGWLIEQARSHLYGMWAAHDASFGEAQAFAQERSELLAEALDGIEGTTDPGSIEQHAAWLEGVIGSHPEDVALAPMFLARLGDWVQAHTSPFLGAGADRMATLAEAERSRIKFPESLPPAPPFEPLDHPEAPAPPDASLRVGMLGDMHIGSKGAEALVKAAIADLNAAEPDLVVQLGDITDSGEKDQFVRSKELLGELRMPYLVMIGNHDVWSTTEERLSGREYFTDTFGRPPDGQVVTRSAFNLALLDSAEHGVSPFPPFDLVSGKLAEGDGGAIVRGSLTPPQHDLLADIAGPDGGPTFVFLHHPPQPFWAFPPIVFGLREVDSGRLHAVADSGNVWGVFAGHTHRCAITRDYDGVPVREVGIPRDFPFGYALLDIGPSGYAYNFKQISDEALLERAYASASVIHRRYGSGPEAARSFTWQPGS